MHIFFFLIRLVGVWMEWLFWLPPVDAFAAHSQNVVYLPRGGTVVKTLVGNVQVGMPPETIKDSMRAGLEVAQYFVLPRHLFDSRVGINSGEFEFPAYFNFFVKRRVREGGVVGWGCCSKTPD